MASPHVPTSDPFDLEDRASFAAALLLVEGLGLVAARRLLRYFRDLIALRQAPREQAILRLKSIPNAAAVVAKLHDDAVMVPICQRVRERRAALLRQGVRVSCTGDDAWPPMVDALGERRRPLLLYHFGASLDVLSRSVALLATTPIANAQHFELAQSLATRLSEASIPLTTAARDGFDVVMQKRTLDASSPVGGAMVLNCGLSRLASEYRPTATELVRRGGLLVSAFDMEHGPFEHDDRARAIFQSAVCPVSVFVNPTANSAEEDAMNWAIEQNRSVFVIGVPGAVALAAHPLSSDADLDWVVAAAIQATSSPAGE